MKKTILIAVSVLFYFSSSVYSQSKPVVAVYRLVNPTGERWIENLGSSVTGTVSLSLALMGEYKIVNPEITEEISSGTADNSYLKKLSDSKGYDDIVFGECSMTDSGYRISLSVYKNKEESVTTNAEQEFASLLDSFDAADRLVDILVEDLSGRKIYYGSLTLVSDSEERFRTVINGVDMGEDFRSADRIITGRHMLELFQDRGSGEKPACVYDFEVKKDRRTTLSVSVPWLTDNENSILRSAENSFFSSKNDFIQKYSEASALFSNPYFMSFRPGIKTRFVKLKKNYETGMTDIVEDKVDDLSVLKVFSPVIDRDINSGNFVTRKVSRLADSVVLFNSLNNNRSSASICSYNAEIKVDGRSSDWENIPTVYEDSLDDMEYKGKGKNQGYDLSRIGFACDKDKLYVMIETSDKKYSKKCKYSLFIKHYYNGIMLTYFPDKNSTYGVILSKDKVVEKTGFYGTSRDVIEMSFPLASVQKVMETDANVIELKVLTEINDKNHADIDSRVVRLMIPTIYNRLSSDAEQ